MTTSTMSRLHRMRKLAYAPLAVAVAAGAICTGAGTGTAASTTTPGTTEAPQSGDAYNWYLINYTGQPIYGYWSAEMASGDTSRVETDKDHPWKPGLASDMAAQFYNQFRFTTFRGHICYSKRWWDYTLSDWGWGEIGTSVFRLEADSAGTLHVYPYWNRSYHSALIPESGVC
ncbi:hypothetical protein [Rhodococcus jostii]|uniref:hypothetical protein n=1 Tax=Rhodococcus jostii TaxID=132919 RepID=UPI0036452E6C